MKITYRRSRLAAAAAVAAAAVAGLLLWSARRAPGEGEPGSTGAGAVHPMASGAPSASSAAIGPSLTALDQGPDDYEDHPLRDAIHQVLANDRQLSAFMYYYNRPLLDAAARAKYRELLSDRAQLASVKHDLLYPEETKADKPGNIKRLMKIDYLREAIEWKDNPARGEAIAMLSELVLTDNFPATMAMDMKLSISGNKREIYELLYQVAPDKALALVPAAKGTRLEGMVAFIANSVDAEKRLEANAEGFVSPPR
jgi:hypothetical protein